MTLEMIIDFKLEKFSAELENRQLHYILFLREYELNELKQR